MNPIPGHGGHEIISQDEPLTHDWRVRQLIRLGIPRTLAEAVADHVDWHQIAALVRRGCPPRLALQIVLLTRTRQPVASSCSAKVWALTCA
jgi:hypothetical protein